MRLISHRGNFKGADPSQENNPSYIKERLIEGYDAEIDIWLLKDGLYSGHEKPKYKIDMHFLQNQRIWVHCKNADAFYELVKYSDINCFFQEEDEISLTSRGYLWVHSRNKNRNLIKNSVVVVPGNSTVPDGLFGICSDYICNYKTPHTPANELPFDLLIIDIDGVLTDGTKIYDVRGRVSGKSYCDLDFTAIKRFKAAGIEVCFLSGDKTVNMAMANTRKIPFFYNEPGTNKTELLPVIINDYEMVVCKRFNKIAYIGDDYYDMNIMNSVDLAFCTKSSPFAVKKIAVTIDSYSGCGVVAKLYDMYENKIPYAYPIDSSDVNPK